MKRTKFLIVGLLGISMAGLAYNFSMGIAVAAEETASSHEGVALPTRMMMSNIARRMSNILEGTLAGSFKYVAQEAGAIVDDSYRINEVFFPIDPEENKWFQQAKIDPNDSKKITKLKEGFDVYLTSIASSLLRHSRYRRASWCIQSILQQGC